MDQGRIHASGYPNVGATCRNEQPGSKAPAPKEEKKAEAAPKSFTQLKPKCPHPMIIGVDKVPDCDPIEPLYCPTGTAGASECNNMRSMAQRGEPWLEDSLPNCPEDEGRITMDQGRTHVIGYPNVGATCKRQRKGEASKPDEEPVAGLMQLQGTPWAGSFKSGGGDPKAWNPSSVEHCPDFNERMVLKDGVTKAIPYPQAGYNCNPSWSF